MHSFAAKLVMFLAPFAVVLSLPTYVLAVSGEIFAAETIARRHHAAPAGTIYGAAFTNVDVRYKLDGLALRKPTTVAIGSSRVLEIEGDFFKDNDFYNLGLVVEGLYEFRRALPYVLAPGARAGDDASGPAMLIGLDSNMFNANWAGAHDAPLFAREVDASRGDALNILQKGVRMWPKIIRGELDLGAVAMGAPHIGVMARLRGDGFKQDGAYQYSSILLAPREALDWQFKDTFARIDSGTKRFEAGDDVDPRALAELTQLVAACKANGVRAVFYMTPFAPAVVQRLSARARHAYVAKAPAAVRPIVEAAGYPFIDFTSCAAQGCGDDEFIDGFHAGPKASARMVAAMADDVPWLDEVVDQGALRARIARSAPGPSLALAN